MEPIIMKDVPPAREARHAVEGVTLARGRGMHLLSFVNNASFTKLPTSAQVDLEDGRSSKGEGEGHSPPTEKDRQIDATATREQETAGEQALPTKTISSNPDVVRGPVWKEGKAVFPYGNYLNYYSSEGHRGTTGLSEDLRLKAVVKKLGKDAFEGKDVLDVGCNSGAVSLSVLRHFGAKDVIGVDIDEALIEAAEENLAHHREAAGESLDVDSAFSRVVFKAQNVVSSEVPAKDAFDVVLCLSVTKWIHFAHGDKGIRKLFRRCARSLRPGGILVLEPQDWQSYKKKRHLTQEIRQCVAGIELRPEKFDEFLLSIGFESLGDVQPENAISQGFKRTIFLYKKHGGSLAVEGETTCPGSTSIPSKSLPIDIRLRAIVQKLGKRAFRGKNVLDVGCGNGSIALSTIEHCHANNVLGIDIDEGCIQSAKMSRNERSSCNLQISNASFLAGDFVASKLGNKGQFDIVLCLLVTKGVHFAHGDVGIRKLLKRCEKSLTSGGTLVLEVQDWQSYSKKRQSALEFRPEQFEQFLLDLGLENLGAVEPGNSDLDGLKRPLHFYRRPIAAEESAEVQETISLKKKRKRVEEASCNAEIATPTETCTLVDAKSAKRRKKELNKYVDVDTIQGHASHDDNGTGPLVKKLKKKAREEAKVDDDNPKHAKKKGRGGA